MATGVPVAVTDVGSNRELVEGGRCGGLLPPDEAAWAVAIGTALADGERTRMRCDAARSRVASDYSMEATLAAYERLYAIGPGT
jgi:glycosyltransferase involved in cell wall biosynthesis